MFLVIQFKCQHLLCSQQHGFTPKKSTLSNLVEYVNFLSSNLANGGQTDAIYTDFAKAFDKVAHKILLKKLDQFPLNSCIKAWIYSYLTDRAQIVCVNGAKSKVINPTSSVPQGSILAPLLFSLFINDLVKDIRCNVLLFADDCKIYQPIKSINDCLALQKDLLSLSIWCNINGLQLNVKKCSIISFTRRTDKYFQHFQYHINNSILPRSRVVKDLGILFDEKLSFSNHVRSIITRASKLLGFICRSFPSHNSKPHRTNRLSLQIMRHIQHHKHKQQIYINNNNISNNHIVTCTKLRSKLRRKRLKQFYMNNSSNNNNINNYYKTKCYKIHTPLTSTTIIISATTMTTAMLTPNQHTTNNASHRYKQEAP